MSEQIAYCVDCQDDEVVATTDCCNETLPACMTVRYQDGTVTCDPLVDPWRSCSDSCRFCGDRLDPRRAEIYRHCSKDDCVTMWQRERLSQYRLALVPKSGFQIVSADDSFLKAARK